MLDLETRKKHTKSVIKFFKDNMYKINPNHEINGMLVLILHWICVGVPLLGVFLFELNWKFYLSSLVWIIICALHLFHNGCIFTRIERELWGCKDWYGPWILPFTILEKLGVEVTSGLANNIFVCWGILLVIWIILRIIFSI
tara:strand:+ start:1482 stop:1907 length:426 start_codon:yes stop_codon:yes gene_type:complete